VNNGQVTVNGFRPSILDVAGRFTNNHGANVFLFGGSVSAGTIVNSGLIDENANFAAVNVNVSVSGPFINNSGGEVDFYDGLTAHFAGLQNMGSFLIQGGNITLDGSLVNDYGAFFHADFSANIFARDVTNSGDMLLRAGDTLQVQRDFDNYGEVEFSHGSFGKMASLVNKRSVVVADPVTELDTMSLTNAGSISVDSRSLLVVGTSTGLHSTGGYFQFSDGTLSESIDANGFGTIKTNDATLDGTLSVSLNKSFNPPVGSFYEFLTFAPGELNGTFATVDNLYFNHSTEEWMVIYDNADGYVALEAVPSPEPGSIALFGTAIVGLAGMLRHKLMQ
jgi:hypothetical protein